MANDEISARVKIDGAKEAVKALQDVGKEAKKIDGLDPEVKVEADTKKADRDIEGLLKKVDKIGADPGTILLTSNATAIANEILDLVTDLDKLDANDPSVQVKVDQINALQGDLDTIESKIKEVNGTPVDIDTKPAKAGLDDVGKSADSSKSVLANMVGNSTQDLGALGGVAGSAGVAIGQIGEYAADALAGTDSLGQVLRNFGTIAVPIAALAAGTQILNEVMAARAKAAESDAKSQELMNDAMSKGGDVSSTYAGELREAGEIQVQYGKATTDSVGGLTSLVAKLPGAAGLALRAGAAFGLFGKKTEDLTDDLAHAGITVDQWSRSVTAAADGPEAAEGAVDAMRAALTRANVPLDEQDKILSSLVDAQGDWVDESERAAEVQKVLGDEIARVNRLNAEILDMRDAPLDAAARSYQAQFQAIEDSKGAADDLAQETEDAAQGALDYAAAINGIDWKNADLGGAVAGMTAFHEQFFSLANIASDNEAAFDAFGKSLEDNGRTFDLNTDKGRANQDALEDLASTLDLQLAAALEDSGGSLTTFQGKAKDMADTLRNRLINELGLSEEAADDMIQRLGLMPNDIETRYKLSGTEEAKLKIGLLQTSIDNLPKDVQARVTQQIIAGDYVGAVNTVQNYYDRHKPTMETHITSDPAGHRAYIQSYFSRNPVSVRVNMLGGIPVREATGGTTPKQGGIAGEAGAEFVKYPDGTEVLLTGATFVPPGTKVTSAARTRSILHRHHWSPPKYANGTGGGTAFIPTSVTINSAVIGNRFDVARAVSKANRDARRLQGSRG